MFVDVVVIGGGLSGLHTAWLLSLAGKTCVVLEHRNRLGGRILCESLDRPNVANAFDTFDLGPAWFWPGQPGITDLINTLHLTDRVFEQWGRGDALYEDAQGQIRRGVSGISMAGSYRLDGGMIQIIEALAAKVPSTAVRFNSTVTAISRSTDSAVHRMTTTALTNGAESEFYSQYVVLAMPPRLATESITFSPVLTEAERQAMRDSPTWMAGHAKLIAVYDDGFWRDNGYSGDAVSHSGPLLEIHDASSRAALKCHAGGHALFGFVGTSADQRVIAIDSNRSLALTRWSAEVPTNPKSA